MSFVRDWISKIGILLFCVILVAVVLYLTFTSLSAVSSHVNISTVIG